MLCEVAHVLPLPDAASRRLIGTGEVAIESGFESQRV